MAVVLPTHPFRRRFNFYQKDGDPTGAASVKGSNDILVKDTSHTQIDANSDVRNVISKLTVLMHMNDNQRGQHQTGMLSSINNSLKNIREKYGARISKPKTDKTSKNSEK